MFALHARIFRPRRGTRRLVSVAAVILALAAVALVMTPEAQATSPMETNPGCEYIDVDEQQVPECLEITHDAVVSDGCNFEIDVDNGCEYDVELVFFCEEDVEQYCSDTEVIDSGEHREYLSMVYVPNGIAGDEEDGIWEGTIGVQIDVLDDATEQTDEGLQPSISYDVRVEYDHVEYDDDESESETSACSSTSPSTPLSMAMLIVALVVGRTVVRR